MVPNTFWKLLLAYQVEIPLMQRDYAQGRKEDRTAQILRDFLNVLHRALDDPARGIDLDFLYGNVRGSTLTLLDGQQRITTLFLLHWYLASRAGELTESNRQILARFTYETRVSSRLFCEALVRKAVAPNCPQLSKLIVDESWYFQSWAQDPTIRAMLGSIDAIQQAFEKCDAPLVWKALVEQDPIRFEFLSMKDYGLADELYVKMNARGKALTDFENFKAWLEEHAPSLTDDQRRSFDMEWTDLFWGLRAEGVRDIGPAYLQFFKGMAFNQALVRGKASLPLTGDEITHLNENRYVSTSFYKDHDFFDPETLRQCCGMLDLLKGAGRKQLDARLVGVPFFLLPEDDQSLFRRFVSPRVTYGDRVLFYALTQFLLATNERPFPDDTALEIALRRWMRVIRNLTLNTTVNAASFPGCLRAIHTLAGNGCLNIYTHLRDAAPAIGTFLDYQAREERVKAGLILREDQCWEAELAAAEDHPFFQGQITFLLEFSRSGDQYDLTKFKEYARKARNIFSEDEHSPAMGKPNFFLSRAMLTRRMWWVGVTSSAENYSLAPRRERWIDQVFQHSENSVVLREVLDAVQFGQEVEDMDAIIKRWQPDPGDLRDEFIRTKEAVGYGEHRWFRYNSDEQIYLLNGQRMSGRHAELRGYGFYKRHLQRRAVDFAPLGPPQQMPLNGEDVRPYVYLDGQVFETRLRFCRCGDPATFGYELQLVAKKGKSFPPLLAEHLSELPAMFVWDEDRSSCRAAIDGDETRVCTILEALADLTGRHCSETAA